MKKILLLSGLCFFFLMTGAFAQKSNADLQLDKDKQAAAAKYKRWSDDLACGSPGGSMPQTSKRCIFYRSSLDTAHKCAQGALTKEDLRGCNQRYFENEQEINRQPASWFDADMAACWQKAKDNEKTFKDTLAKERASGNLSGTEAAEFDAYYDKNLHPLVYAHQDFFKITKNNCLDDQKAFTTALGLIQTKVNAKKITITKANYGENCSNVNKSKMDLANNYKKACNGKLSCSYTINAFGVDGDPAPNCPKELVVTYSCGTRDKTLKIDKEAHGKAAQLDCSK